MIRWMDSFDNYSVLTDKYDFVFNAALAGGGPFGDSVMQLGNTDNRVEKNFPTAYGPTFIYGCRHYFGNYSGNGSAIFSLLDGTSLQCELRQAVSGSQYTLYVTRNGTTIASGSIVMSQLIYYYIEFKVTIHDSTGIVVTRIDGVTDINASGLDTKNTGNATATGFRLGDTAGGARSINYTDLIIMDGVDSGVAGFPNNDFIGDIRVQSLLPNGNGNSSQFTGSDGNSTDNYLLVDESAPNGDTDYVETLTVGNKDTYTMQNLSAGTGLVYGLQMNPRARKTDAGSRKFKNVVRSAGVEEDSATEKILSLSYQNFPEIREDDPSNNPWDISSINAMEVGYKLTT